EVHDQKVQLDNLQHVKYTLAQQLEEARRRLEDAERRHKPMPSPIRGEFNLPTPIWESLAWVKRKLG
ncbi:hypothetical protein COOONC_25533, partial [Cooperia oncophora]